MRTTMSLRLFLFTLLSIPAMLPSDSVLAACLAGTPTLEQEYQSATMVFVGRVTAQEFTLESKNSLDGITYAIHIEEVLRGPHAKSVELFSENSSGRFSMRVGAAYLIFAHKELDQLQVDNCGNSGLLSEKAQTLATLRKINP